MCLSLWLHIIFLCSSNHRGKIDPRAIKCIIVSYSPTQKGYKCQQPPTKQFLISHDVTVDANKQYFQPKLEGKAHSNSFF